MYKHTGFLVYFTLVYLFLLSYTSAAWAQEDSPTAIMLKTKTDGESIQLRWAPSKPDLWWFTNKYGYRVERITLYREGKAIEPKSIILADSLKPYAVEAWAEVIHDSNLFGVAAQAIHGEDISMNNNLADVDMVTVINTVKEREMRFSFALSAADQSMRVAAYSGLYFEDRTAKKGETYLYRIHSNTPAHLALSSPAAVVTGLAEVKTLPIIQEVKGTYKNGMVEISWNQELAVFDYIGFWVEKSKDQGKTFDKVHKNPIVNTFDQADMRTRYLLKMDTLPADYHTYQYRVRGVDPFGEIGPSSKIIRIKASETLTAIPAIDEAINEENKQVRIRWKLPQEQVHLIHHQELLRAPSAEEPYIVIAKHLSNQAEYYIDIMPLQSNYYKLAFIDSAQEISYSLPYMITMVDSFPPQIPTDFRGKVDQEGKVTLTWTPSPDSDVLGYSIFRSNTKNEESILRNGHPITGNVFTDSVSMKILNTEIYYQITAFDKVGNQSAKSEVIRLEKPDIIPPAPTTFKNVKSSNTGVSLSWHKSSSKDIAAYALYRKKAQTDEIWNLLAIRPVGDSLSWEDQSMTDFSNYYYTLVVVDRAKNESKPAKPVKGKKIDTKKREAITQFSGKLDLMQKHVRLWWNYERRDVVKFLLYRQVGDGQLRLYKELDPLSTEYTDSNIQTGKKYLYRIKAVMLDGAESAFSKQIIL